MVIRQWLVNHFDIWEQEQEECLKLIQQDCRNNSAWNQLYFCVSRTININPNLMDSIIEKQVSYAVELISMEPDNECPFNYVNGLLILTKKSLEDFPNLKILLQTLANGGNRFSLGLLLTYSTFNVELFKNYAEKLIEADPIRKNYWQYRLNSIQANQNI